MTTDEVRRLLRESNYGRPKPTDEPKPCRPISCRLTVPARPKRPDEALDT